VKWPEPRQPLTDAQAARFARAADREAGRAISGWKISQQVLALCRRCHCQMRARVRGYRLWYCARCLPHVKPERIARLIAARSRARAAARADRACRVCGIAFVAERSTRVYCSVACRVAHHRRCHRA
jgi:hypothetical protein